MDKTRLFSSIWMRILVFLWMIVFPLVFIAIPALEMAMGEAELGLAPAWGFGVWVLGPLVVAIVLKYVGGGNTKNPSD